jgi:hypothetical protein
VCSTDFDCRLMAALALPNRTPSSRPPGIISTANPSQQPNGHRRGSLHSRAPRWICRGRRGIATRLPQHNHSAAVQVSSPQLKHLPPRDRPSALSGRPTLARLMISGRVGFWLGCIWPDRAPGGSQGRSRLQRPSSPAAIYLMSTSASPLAILSGGRWRMAFQLDLSRPRWVPAGTDLVGSVASQAWEVACDPCWRQRSAA